LQPSPEALREKYSRLLTLLIEETGCRVLVCGMNLKTTNENKFRTDCKFPEYGLNLPENSSIHLKGLSWALEMEILSRCDVCLCHASGFSEALYLKRPWHVYLVDPPLLYLLRLIRHRMPFFDFYKTTCLMDLLWQPHSERRILRLLRKALAGCAHNTLMKGQ
jgi:hypothetical protein